MKTKELIEALLKADPEQGTEVCIGNKPIHFINKCEAYWDGPLQVLVQDKTNPYYNVIGAEFVRSGRKIQIHLLSIEDAIFENPDLPVKAELDIDKNLVERYRKEAKEMFAEIEAWGKTKEQEKK